MLSVRELGFVSRSDVRVHFSFILKSAHVCHFVIHDGAIRWIVGVCANTYCGTHSIFLKPQKQGFRWVHARGFLGVLGYIRF